MSNIITDSKSKPTQIVDLHNHNVMEKHAKIAYNEKLDAVAQDLEDDIKRRLENNKVMDKKLLNLEVMPITNYILVRPFDKNPYVKFETKGNIIISGYDGNFMNPDTGEVDQEEQMIVVGTVIEVGPECKYIREGDDIFYTKTSLVPIPFYGKGFQLVNENRVAVVVNEGLKKRFGME